MSIEPPTRDGDPRDTPAPEPSKDEFTIDAFLGGALSIRQLKRGYRAGLDAVLLAATCTATAGQRVADCGAGVGTVGLCAARRLPGVSVTLIEREAAYAALAAANIRDNALSDRAAVVTADLTAPLGSGPLAPLIGTVDHVLANPPYAIDADGTRATHLLKDAANAMPAGALDHWARAMAALLRPGGSATMIHRADALGDILQAYATRFGGVVVRPVQPRAGEPANRVLVRGIRGSRAPLMLGSAIIVHTLSGGFCPLIEQALRHGHAIPL